MSDETECLTIGAYSATARGPLTVRRLLAVWTACRGIPTADLEQITAAPGDAARLAQLANAAEAAHQRAKEPK